MIVFFKSPALIFSILGVIIIASIISAFIFSRINAVNNTIDIADPKDNTVDDSYKNGSVEDTFDPTALQENKQENKTQPSNGQTNKQTLPVEIKWEKDPEPWQRNGILGFYITNAKIGSQNYKLFRNGEVIADVPVASTNNTYFAYIDHSVYTDVEPNIEVKNVTYSLAVYENGVEIAHSSERSVMIDNYLYEPPIVSTPWSEKCNVKIELINYTKSVDGGEDTYTFKLLVNDECEFDGYSLSWYGYDYEIHGYYEESGRVNNTFTLSSKQQVVITSFSLTLQDDYAALLDGEIYCINGSCPINPLAP
jgi:hypothetical protein